VGIRKVIGAEKRSLVFQILGESLMLSILALLVAVLIAYALLPFFNSLTQKNLQLFDEPLLWFWISGLTIFSGIISGFYPAFYLSSFKPISVLKAGLLNKLSGVAI